MSRTTRLYQRCLASDAFFRAGSALFLDWGLGARGRWLVRTLAVSSHTFMYLACILACIWRSVKVRKVACALRVRVRARFLCLCGLGALFISCDAACDAVPVQMDLERMTDQARFEAYESSRFFSDNRVLRVPPEGTIPTERPRIGAANGSVDGSGGGSGGGSGDAQAEQIPVPVTRALLERGSRRFEAICAACHGPLGDGRSPVADRMIRRRPPSLLAHFSSDRIFLVIGEGYGLMPRFPLPAEDRWAVAAYVQALELASRVALSSLPVDLRAKATHALQDR